MIRRRGSKYGNIPTMSRHTGRVFQSRKEANREPALLAMQNAGLIRDLKYQVPYRLEVYGTQAVEALLEYMESHYDPDTTGGRMAADVRHSRHLICKYVSDFTHEDADGNVTVEDVKSQGTRTPVYAIKKRLMLACHGVEIVEPEEGGVEQRARGAGVAGRRTGSRLTGGRAS